MLSRRPPKDLTSLDAGQMIERRSKKVLEKIMDESETL